MNKLGMVASDIHFTGHHRPGWETFLLTVKIKRPQFIVLLGDVCDFYSVMGHRRKRQINLADEVDFTYGELSRLRCIAGDDCEIFFVEGNHETRNWRKLADHAPEYKDLDCLQIPSLLRLDANNIKFYSEDTRFQIGGLYFIHCHQIKGGGANIAKTVCMNLGVNAIVAHHHIDHHFVHRRLDGTTVNVWCNPCLCELDAEYTYHNQWRLGFSVVEFWKGKIDVERIIIKENGSGFYCKLDGQYLEVDETGKLV